MATRRLAWLTVALAGLLAVVGVASRAPRPFGVGGTSGVGPSFFDYAFTTVVLVLAAELVLLVLAVVFEVHRRGKFEPPQRAWWKQFVALGVVVLFLTALARVHPLHPKTPGAGTAKLGSRAAAQEKRTRGVHGRNVRLKWEELAVGGGILAVLVVAGVVAGRRQRRRGPDEDDRLRPAAAEVSELLDDALADLRSASDFRRAVIAAYARMEGALAAHGLPRRRSEAPLEYVERALVHLRASQGSVRRLTDLFEWAKFSQHQVDAGMRDAAVDALVDVRDELRAFA